jgi:hypothetical protein
MTTLLLFSFTITEVNASAAATNCSEQLHFFFSFLGLPIVAPILPVLNYTTGFIGLLPYVQVEFDFQEVARTYQFAIDGNSTSTWVNYVSADIPWCASDILIVCTDQVISQMAKNLTCNLTDFDLGGTSEVAGRMFIHPDQVASCLGRFAVVFINTTLQPAFNDAQYTYDIFGILDHTKLNKTAARNLYRSQPCTMTDGNIADTTTQVQFRCLGSRIGCNGTRPFSLATLDVIPIPEFACRNKTNGNTSEFIVWRVKSLQPPEGVNGYYGISFYENGAIQPLPFVFLESNPPQYPDQILEASTQRQYKVVNQDFNSQAYVYYAGRITGYAPEYSRSSDKDIRDIPCICDFSVDCIGGVIDVTSPISSVINRDNKIPIADPGPFPTIPRGNLNVTLNGIASYDDDNGPKPLTYLWEYYQSFPPTLPVFNLSGYDVTQPIIPNIPTTGFPPGTYVFILYVSDGQAISWNFFNVTITANQVFAIVAYDYTCTVFTCCVLNGTLSYSSDPNISITSSWAQFIGHKLTSTSSIPCDPLYSLLTNTTELLAFFSTDKIGQYGFNLTLTDGTSISFATIYVFVVPNFTQPIAPPFSLPNYTNPPLRTRPPNNRTNYTFPNFSGPYTPRIPISPSTPVPIIVPPVFPDYPSDSVTDILFSLGFLVVALTIFMIFVSLAVIFFPREYISHLDVTRYQHTSSGISGGDDY